MQQGIYKIQNEINGKVYIGRTSSFKRRFYQYRYDFKNKRKRCMNEYLLSSMIKYGFDAFKFSIIEVCEPSVIEDREIFWIEFYDSTDRSKGYNLRKDKNGKMLTADSTRRKISDRLKLEWANGVRSDHSEKIKQCWLERDRVKQSEVLKNNLTKYNYELGFYPESRIVDYSELCRLGYKSALSAFFKNKTDCVIVKGLRIRRFKIAKKVEN